MEQIRIDTRKLSLRARRRRADAADAALEPLRYATPGGGADGDDDLLARIGLLVDGNLDDEDEHS